MNDTIKLSNGKGFNLLEDNLTAQDYKELSGIEVRKIRHLQRIAFDNDFIERQKVGLLPPLCGNL